MDAGLADARGYAVSTGDLLLTNTYCASERWMMGRSEHVHTCILPDFTEHPLTSILIESGQQQITLCRRDTTIGNHLQDRSPLLFSFGLTHRGL